MMKTRQFARYAALFGLCGIVALFVYATAFGGNSHLPMLYYAFLVLVIAGMIGALLPRWLQLGAAIREGERNGVIAPRRKYLVWIGLLFCALPALWLYWLFRIFGAPSPVNPILVYGPAFALLFVGGGLLFYSYLSWLRAIRSIWTKRELHP